MERKSRKRASSSDPLRLGSGTELADLLVCPGCHEAKDVDKWLLLNSDFDPQNADGVCDDCRENGVPKIPLIPIPLSHIKLVDAYFRNMDNPRNATAAAAEASGLTQRTVTEILSGRRAPATRRVFQLKLESVGLGPEGVAMIMGDCAVATEQKWNPKEEVFSEFPDYRTRLNVAKYAGKLQELEPPKSSGPTQVNQIVIKTNLGSVGSPQEVDSPSRIRVRTPEEIVEIDTT